MFSGTKDESLQALKLLQDEGNLNHADMLNALLKVFPKCAETKRSQSDPGASGGASAASAAASSTSAESSAPGVAKLDCDDGAGASAAKKLKIGDGSDEPKASLKI